MCLDAANSISASTHGLHKEFPHTIGNFRTSIGRSTWHLDTVHAFLSVLGRPHLETEGFLGSAPSIRADQLHALLAALLL